MAARVSEEVTTFFTGDSSGLEEAYKRATEAARGNSKAEKAVADYIAKLRRDREKETALGPIKAAQMAEKEAQARKRAADKAANAEIEAEKKKQKAKVDAAAEAEKKIKRQREASTLSGIGRELRDNFGANARKKIGGVLQNTLGLSEDASQGLVSKLARVAPYIGAAAAGGALLVKTFREASRFAGEQADKMAALSEEMRQSSNINVFSSSAEGVESLSGKLSEALKQLNESKVALQEQDPYEFGEGLWAGIKTAFARASQAKADFLSNAPKGLLKAADAMNPLGWLSDKFKLQNVADAGFSNFDRKAIGAENLRLSQRGKVQETAKLRGQRGEALDKELDITRDRIRGEQQVVVIKELQIAKEKELASAIYATLSTSDKAKVDSKYDEQIQAAQEELSFLNKRFFVSASILGVQRSARSEGQKQALITQKNLDLVRQELSGRVNLTSERRKGLLLEELGYENELRAAQRLADLKPRSRLNEEFRQTRIREERQKRQDKRLDANDGLINVERDISGEILGGTDILTGQKRKVSQRYLDTKSSRSGLQTGRLETGNLDSRFGRSGASTFDDLKKPGINDQSAGKTALEATNKLIAAANISNAYLMNISRNTDMMQYST